MMKIHDLASALQVLARALRECPNLDLKDLDSALRRPHQSDASSMAVNLSTLVELSRIDKNTWLSFINSYGFPISLRPRDASRDILGKLLRYLEENPAERKRLKASAKNTGQTSPELTRALSALLND